MKSSNKIKKKWLLIIQIEIITLFSIKSLKRNNDKRINQNPSTLQVNQSNPIKKMMTDNIQYPHPEIIRNHPTQRSKNPPTRTTQSRRRQDQPPYFILAMLISPKARGKKRAGSRAPRTASRNKPARNSRAPSPPRRGVGIEIFARPPPPAKKPLRQIRGGARRGAISARDIYAAVFYRARARARRAEWKQYVTRARGGVLVRKRGLIALLAGFIFRRLWWAFWG